MQHHYRPFHQTQLFATAAACTRSQPPRTTQHTHSRIVLECIHPQTSPVCQITRHKNSHQRTFLTTRHPKKNHSNAPIKIVSHISPAQPYQQPGVSIELVLVLVVLVVVAVVLVSCRNTIERKLDAIFGYDGTMEPTPLTSCLLYFFRGVLWDGWGKS